MRKILIPVIALILLTSIPMQAMAASGYSSDALLDVGEQQFSVMCIQATYNEPVAITGDNKFSYKPGKNVNGHKYKIVMRAPSLPPQPNHYTYIWTP